MRKLLSKGPKYRIPSDINFYECKKTIVDALDDYSNKWQKREKVGKGVLSLWKSTILKRVDSKIQFYLSNPSLLPSNNGCQYKGIRSSLNKLHERYVLVPADKASNNIIIV